MNHSQTPQYKTTVKESVYFTLRLIASLIIYAAIGAGCFFFPQKTIPFLPIVIYLILLLFLHRAITIGAVKAQAVKITSKQFAEIFEIVEKQAKTLGLKKTPHTYLLQSGGLLNAFATKLFARNYIVIFSDLMEDFYDGNPESIEFVIAHELGHIKRKHISKELFLFPSILIPFLPQAHSRACEYTCDNIGMALSPKGAIKGLLTLAGGKKLNARINPQEFINQRKNDPSFWRWFFEKISTHPNLYKRLQKVYTKENLNNISSKKEKHFSHSQSTTFTQATTKPQQEDHSKYWPQGK